MELETTTPTQIERKPEIKAIVFPLSLSLYTYCMQMSHAALRPYRLASCLVVEINFEQPNKVFFLYCHEPVERDSARFECLIPSSDIAMCVYILTTTFNTICQQILRLFVFHGLSNFGTDFSPVDRLTPTQNTWVDGCLATRMLRLSAS